MKKIDFIVGEDDGALRMCRRELNGLAVKDTRLFFDNDTDRATSNYKRARAYHYEPLQFDFAMR